MCCEGSMQNMAEARVLGPALHGIDCLRVGGGAKAGGGRLC